MSLNVTSILVAALMGALAIPIHVSADPTAPQYTVIDLGTFGGPNGYQNSPGRSLNNEGEAIGEADTAMADPNAPICFADCHIAPAFKWERGRLTNLGALRGPNSSCATWINDRGLVVGDSETGVDQAAGSPLEHAVLWQGGKVVDLGTFGGNQSDAGAINNRGQVVGTALNATPDPIPNSASYFGPNCAIIPPTTTEARAFLWYNGVKTDLGTLGGPDAAAYWINERGQVAGQSFTNATPNPTTGYPSLDPFLWENGHMMDLGSLGGTSGVPNWLNNRDQVVGTSNLSGDQTHHAFLWDGGGLKDLGTLGGSNSEAFFVNDGGDVVGRADTSPSKPDHHAFLWKDGVMTDLGTLGGYPNSTAYGVNNQDQVIGDYGGDHGFLWQTGQIYDLTSLLVPGSGMQVAAAAFINDRGEIYGAGALPNGDEHVILLEPVHRSTAAQGISIPSGSVGSSGFFTVWFDSSALGQGMVLFGSGPGCSGLVETATRDQGAGTTSHMVPVAGNDLPGTVGDNGIQPGASYWYEAVTVTTTGTEIDNNGGKCYSVTVPPM